MNHDRWVFRLGDRQGLIFRSAISLSVWRCAAREIPPTPDICIDLREATVCLTQGARENRLRDHLVEEHHCLRFHGTVGRGLRHVAAQGETWLALAACDR